jgi:hypothetical protein
MKKSEELLQRCFDGDLNDSEMKELFFEMSNNDELRIQFRSLQTLRRGLQSLRSPNVPQSLDKRINRMNAVPPFANLPGTFGLRQIIAKKFTLSIPAFAAAVLLLLAGSYFAVSKVAAAKTETEFVYIMQLPTVEVYGIIN